MEPTAEKRKNKKTQARRKGINSSITDNTLIKNQIEGKAKGGREKAQHKSRSRTVQADGKVEWWVLLRSPDAFYLGSEEARPFRVLTVNTPCVG